MSQEALASRQIVPTSLESPASRLILAEPVLEEAQAIATETLVLVHRDGIMYASADGVFLGGDFTRDLAVTAIQDLRAERKQLPDEFRHSPLVLQSATALIRKIDQQSLVDDPLTGAKRGQFPHEVRREAQYYQHLVNLTPEQLKQGEKPWSLNPKTKAVENYDASDATALWVYAIGEFNEAGVIELDARIYGALRLASEYLLGELRRFSGLAGYDFDGTRPFAELFTKTWKDARGTFRHSDGRLPKHPILDIWTNGAFYAGLKQAARMFKEEDPGFSRTLDRAAGELKIRINSNGDGGFLIRDRVTGKYYLREAKAASGNLNAPCLDPAMLLGLYVNGEGPIDDRYVHDIVERVMMPDFNKPGVGLLLYPTSQDKYGIVYDEESGFYQRGPSKWQWPDQLISEGLEHLGYRKEAIQVSSGMLEGLMIGDDAPKTPVEVYLYFDGQRVPYQDPKTKRLAPQHQTWAAAAMHGAVQTIRTLGKAA